MTTDTYDEAKAVMEEIKYLPAISIIQPFEPMMSSKSELEYRLKRALEKVETELMANYPVYKAVPVIVKLHHLIGGLNYNTHKKSIAIFVSPLVEKVYYLDIRVEEKTVVDETFEMRDLVHSKKQNIEYLVLMLSAERSKMYLAKGSKFTLIKSNVSDHLFEYRTDTDKKDREEILLHKFLHQMDEDLGLILNAYNLPVFILGAENIVGYFKKITKNGEKLLGFIRGDYIHVTEGEIQKILQPYIKDWEIVKQQNVLLEIGKAVDYEKVAFGIEDVWKAAGYKNNRLLVVEKDFVCTTQFAAEVGAISSQDINANNPFYIKNAVDQVIEKVLQKGGDVEFIENDALKDYGRIALIEYY